MRSTLCGSIFNLDLHALPYKLYLWDLPIHSDAANNVISFLYTLDLDPSVNSSGPNLVSTCS